jgi:phenylalanyl-tRNA synthetase alpha subunit
VVPEAQNSIQTQKDEGVEKISNVESPQIESNSVEKNVVENKVGIENAVLENKLSEKKELESPVENTIPKVETETQEVNSAVVEEKKDDESVNKDIEMKLPNNW